MMNEDVRIQFVSSRSISKLSWRFTVVFVRFGDRNPIRGNIVQFVSILFRDIRDISEKNKHDFLSVAPTYCQNFAGIIPVTFFV